MSVRNITFLLILSTDRARHDLMLSSIHVRRPRYPCQWRPDILRNISGSSRQILRQSVELGEVEHPVDVLVQMRRLLDELAGPKTFKLTEEMAHDLNAARNEIQYHILALPECNFRIAALLFSDMFFFRSPDNSGIREKLAQSLRYRLETSKNTALMGLWMATIGALAIEMHAQADDSFIQLAATYARKLSTADFNSFQSRLCQVLWCTDCLQNQLESIWRRGKSVSGRVTTRLIALFASDESE